MKRFLRPKSLVTLAALCLFAVKSYAAPPLAAYGADPRQTSVSGLSSGAFLAVQMQVAYSSTIVGSGIVAGGPYYCAADNLANTGLCMGQVAFFPPNPYLIARAARGIADEKLIDRLENLPGRRIYVFSGTDDTVVLQPAVDATVSFFQNMGVKKSDLKYVNSLSAGHAMITPNYGNDCSANAPPYISHCTMNGTGYDQAGDVLRQIYGNLNKPVDRPTGQVVSFDQRPFAGTSTGMADTGFLYLPQSCTGTGTHCRVHVALHGCMQAAESVGDQFYTRTGYNNWADSNSIIVLYPQVNKSTALGNPQGCWDWWGYTGYDYAFKTGKQMKAIMNMVNRLTQHP